MGWSPAYKVRSRVIAEARAMARSGQHADHVSILAHLHEWEEFRPVLDKLDRPLRGQLDKLCALTKNRAPSIRSFSASGSGSDQELPHSPSPIS